MKQVTTARGRIINMGALAAKHEKTKAVSNVPVNARGDIVDNRGNVKVSKEEVAKKVYESEELQGATVEVPIKENNEVSDDSVETVEEIGRTMRTRDNGSEYYEVEYSDGSMEEIEVDDES